MSKKPDWATVRWDSSENETLLRDAVGRNDWNDGRSNSKGLPLEMSEWAHKQGIFAEHCVAKYLGAYLTHVTDKPDRQKLLVHPGWPVIRVYGAANFGNGLIIDKKRAQDDEIWVLVIVERPRRRGTIIGWCYGKEGMVKENWAPVILKRCPNYLVAKEDLHPMQELLSLLLGEEP